MAAHRYADGAFRRVDGWLSLLDARLIHAVGAQQNDRRIVGSVGEIGVHHGRLFILLALLLKEEERAFAVDIFGDQHLNQDRSGQGDETIFRRNLARFGVPEGRVAVLRRSSLEVTWPDLAAAVGQPARLVSIDGGHTAAITANDLAIADEGLAEQGVIVLDDYFNPEFPEVSEGLCRYLLPGRPLAPFAIGDNKLFLARPAAAPAYRDFLAGAVPRRYFVRRTAMFGQELLVFRTPRQLSHRIRQTEIARRLRDHPFGRALQPIVRRVLRG